MDKFGKVITNYRKPVTMFLMVLILVHYAPTEVFGPQVDSQIKSMLGPILNPIQALMNNVFVRLFLWLALLWACCSGKDELMFLLIVVYFLAHRQ